MERNVRQLKDIKEIILLKKGEGEGLAAVTVYKATSKRKKQSDGLKVVERLARRNAEAQQAFANAYLQRHGRSSEKKRDGWFWALGENMMRSSKRAQKKFSFTKILGW